jgi:hypothetical protein
VSNKENISFDPDKNDNEFDKSFAEFFLDQLKHRKNEEKLIIIQNHKNFIKIEK